MWFAAIGIAPAPPGQHNLLIIREYSDSKRIPSPEGAEENSPERKPGVSGKLATSPEGATQLRGFFCHNNILASVSGAGGISWHGHPAREVRAGRSRYSALHALLKPPTGLATGRRLYYTGTSILAGPDAVNIGRAAR